MSLKEKLKSARAQENEMRSHAVNAEAERNDWVRALEELFRDIRQWFEDYRKDGLVQFTLRKKNVTEDGLGSYETNNLELSFSGDVVVVFDPRGTRVIGSWGRCDMYLKGGIGGDRYLLIRNRRSGGEFEWLLMPEWNKRDKVVLTKERLEGIIDKWIV